MEGKVVWPRSADNRHASLATLTRGWCVLTTMSDFFTPKTTSLERYGSPSGYNAVESLWKPGASITTCR